ncbi:MAG: hypothetical protein WBF83_09320 [Moheibacter sp.]
MNTMIFYNVSIPESKESFFQEFLELIGAQYKKEDEIDFLLTDEQKKVLLDQENISLDDCKDADDFYEEMKKKYDL